MQPVDKKKAELGNQMQMPDTCKVEGCSGKATSCIDEIWMCGDHFDKVLTAIVRRLAHEDMTR